MDASHSPPRRALLNAIGSMGLLGVVTPPAFGEAPAAEHTALAHNLPTCGAVVFDCPVSAWSNLGLQTNTLREFMTPKQLKAESDAP